MSSCPFHFQVAADVLFRLLKASQQPDAIFQVLVCLKKGCTLELVCLSTVTVQESYCYQSISACGLQVAGVVTQPAKVRKFKGGKARPGKPHPVEVLAAEWLLPQNILTPEQSSDVGFSA